MNKEKTPGRLGWDEYFMQICRAVAERATCDRGRSGCLIVRDKQILVTGYVGSPAGFPHCDEVGHLMKTVIHEDNSHSEHCLRTAHAEQNAVSQAARLGIALEGGTLYSRMTPCRNCAMLLIHCGIRRICCENRYHRASEGEELFEQAGIKIDYLDDAVVSYPRQ